LQPGPDSPGGIVRDLLVDRVILSSAFWKEVNLAYLDSWAAARHAKLGLGPAAEISTLA
jgi:hypothetical protein